MLESIKFLKEYRTFGAGDEFAFDTTNVNLLVGDQGCGKSTLVNILTTGKTKYGEIAKVTGDAADFYYLDFEKHNPRTKSYIDSPFQIASKFSSHGEINLKIFKKIVNADLKDPSIIIVDEVDMALSIRSCYKLAAMMKKLSKNGHQVIAVIHNPIVIQEFKEVLSIEHKKWLSSKEFIKTHMPKTKKAKGII